MKKILMILMLVTVGLTPLFWYNKVNAFTPYNMQQIDADTQTKTDATGVYVYTVKYSLELNWDYIFFNMDRFPYFGEDYDIDSFDITLYNEGWGAATILEEGVHFNNRNPHNETDLTLAVERNMFNYSYENLMVTITAYTAILYAIDWDEFIYLNQDEQIFLGYLQAAGYTDLYDVGYNAGHFIGYKNGFDIGQITGQQNLYDDGANAWGLTGTDAWDYINGWSIGQSSGYATGYNLGVLEVMDESLNIGTFIQIAADGVGGLLAVELLPNISLGMIVAVPLIFGLIAFVVGVSSGRKGSK